MLARGSGELYTCKYPRDKESARTLVRRPNDDNSALIERRLGRVRPRSPTGIANFGFLRATLVLQASWPFTKKKKKKTDSSSSGSSKPGV